MVFGNHLYLQIVVFVVSFKQHEDHRNSGGEY